MKVVDLNLLIYAANRDSAPHAKARRWLEEVLNGDEPVAFPWVVILGFLRITTNPRVFPNPLKPEQAMSMIEAWMESPSACPLQAGREHWRILKSLLAEAGTAGNLTTDAHLAALAIEHGAEIQTSDTDFARFEKLRWVNPLG